jgi:hypothetical protein
VAAQFMQWMLAEGNCTVFVHHDDDKPVPYAEFMERRKKQAEAAKKKVNKRKDKKKVKATKGKSKSGKGSSGGAKGKRKRASESESDEDAESEGEDGNENHKRKDTKMSTAAGSGSGTHRKVRSCFCSVCLSPMTHRCGDRIQEKVQKGGLNGALPLFLLTTSFLYSRCFVFERRESTGYYDERHL